MAVDIRQVDLYVTNLDCEHDAAAIERGLRGNNGLIELTVYPHSAKVSFRYDGNQTSPEALSAALSALGFPVAADRGLTGPPKPWRNPKVLTSLASGGLLLVGWLLSFTVLPPAVPTILYVVAIICGGYFFGREALEDLIRRRLIGIELLMSTAAVVASLLGLPAEGAMLVFLYSISEAAEGYTGEKTRSAIRALMDLAPKTAIVHQDGGTVEVPAEDLRVGDVFLVRPGQSFPTDGVIVSGTSGVNQAPVTGENIPVDKAPGDSVFAGSLNGDGALDVQATKTAADNTIARIIHMVEEAQEKKGTNQRLIERFGRWYSPTVLLLGLLIALIPPLLVGAPWSEWLGRATVFIVAAAPCALVISVPITMVAALGTGARKGVLVKGGVYLEQLATVSVVALDKTGTLTKGQPGVTDIVISSALGSPSSDEVLAIAAGIEQRSQHPIAQAIVHHAESRQLSLADVQDVQSLTGAGAFGSLDGRSVYVGSPALFTSLGVSLDDLAEATSRLETDGKTVVVVGDDQSAWGLIALRDELRPNVQTTLAALRSMGVNRIVMLTGDNERAANAIASALNLDEVHAGLSPEDKVRQVRALAQSSGHVVMVGDGVNDAPAMAEATVGVAMGAAGTDVALETADVALMADDLEKLVYALHLAHRTRGVIRQNLVLSVIVIGALAIGAVGGGLSLPIAVLGHEISEFIVIGSGLRMLRA